MTRLLLEVSPRALKKQFSGASSSGLDGPPELLGTLLVRLTLPGSGVPASSPAGAHVPSSPRLDFAPADIPAAAHQPYRHQPSSCDIAAPSLSCFSNAAAAATGAAAPLQTAEALLNLIWSGLPIAVTVFTERGAVVLQNAASIGYFGVRASAPPADLLGPGLGPEAWVAADWAPTTAAAAAAAAAVGLSELLASRHSESGALLKALLASRLSGGGADRDRDRDRNGGGGRGGSLAAAAAAAAAAAGEGAGLAAGALAELFALDEAKLVQMLEHTQLGAPQPLQSIWEGIVRVPASLHPDAPRSDGVPAAFPDGRVAAAGAASPAHPPAGRSLQRGSSPHRQPPQHAAAPASSAPRGGGPPQGPTLESGPAGRGQGGVGCIEAAAAGSMSGPEAEAAELCPMVAASAAAFASELLTGGGSSLGGAGLGLGGSGGLGLSGCGGGMLQGGGASESATGTSTVDHSASAATVAAAAAAAATGSGTLRASGGSASPRRRGIKQGMLKELRAATMQALRSFGLTGGSQGTRSPPLSCPVGGAVDVTNLPAAAAGSPPQTLPATHARARRLAAASPFTPISAAGRPGSTAYASYTSTTSDIATDVPLHCWLPPANSRAPPVVPATAPRTPPTLPGPAATFSSSGPDLPVAAHVGMYSASVAGSRAGEAHGAGGSELRQWASHRIMSADPMATSTWALMLPAPEASPRHHFSHSRACPSPSTLAPSALQLGDSPAASTKGRHSSGGARPHTADAPNSGEHSAHTDTLAPLLSSVWDGGQSGAGTGAGIGAGTSIGAAAARQRANPWSSAHFSSPHGDASTRRQQSGGRAIQRPRPSSPAGGLGLFDRESDRASAAVSAGGSGLARSHTANCSGGAARRPAAGLLARAPSLNPGLRLDFEGANQSNAGLSTRDSDDARASTPRGEAFLRPGSSATSAQGCRSYRDATGPFVAAADGGAGVDSSGHARDARRAAALNAYVSGDGPVQRSASHVELPRLLQFASSIPPVASPRPAVSRHAPASRHASGANARPARESLAGGGGGGGSFAAPVDVGLGADGVGSWHSGTAVTLGRGTNVTVATTAAAAAAAATVTPAARASGDWPGAGAGFAAVAFRSASARAFFSVGPPAKADAVAAATGGAWLLRHRPGGAPTPRALAAPKTGRRAVTGGGMTGPCKSAYSFTSGLSVLGLRPALGGRGGAGGGIGAAATSPVTLARSVEAMWGRAALEATASPAVAASARAAALAHQLSDDRIGTAGDSLGHSPNTAASHQKGPQLQLPFRSVAGLTPLDLNSVGGGGAGGPPAALGSPLTPTMARTSGQLPPPAAPDAAQPPLHLPPGGAGGARGGGPPGAGLAEPEEAWHEVRATALVDPASGGRYLVLVQRDVTAKVEAERHIAQVSEAEHRLLEQVFPRHVLAHMAAGGWPQSAPPPPPPPPPPEHMPALSGGVPPAGQADDSSHAAAGAAEGGLGQSPGSAVQPWRPHVHDWTQLATWHPQVTLLFADIQGFTPMCKLLPAVTVMAFLNDLYTRFDAMLDQCGVYKVETIGDCYVVAGGLIAKDADGMAAVQEGAADERQADRVFAFAQAMLRVAAAVALPTTGEPVKIRVGIHSGPVVSGVVGTHMPRFCLFGDTINTASRMETASQPGSIHVSSDTYALLSTKAQDGWRATGGIEVKGKGVMETYLWAPNGV